MSNNPTVLEIDSKSLKYNLNYFKSKIGVNTRVLVVVKAFGYGSDAIEIAKLIQNDISYFAVAYTDEGITLRTNGITKPILVLHPQMANLNSLLENNLEPNLYSFRLLVGFLSLTKSYKKREYPIHIKFNTGLNRLGFLHSDIETLFIKLKDKTSVKVNSIFSHLAASEDNKERAFNLFQIDKFKNIAISFEKYFGFKPMLHMTNTSGILNYPEAHFDMVRLGIGLYGFANDKVETSKLRNVLSLKSVISQIHNIEKGDSIGYNRALIAKKLMQTATIPIGHADGISRMLGKEKGYVTINNHRAPIVGNVCMDMIMVDVTNIECAEGDEVVLFDNQQTVEELAINSNTISYELISSISQRARRKVIP